MVLNAADLKVTLQFATARLLEVRPGGFIIDGAHAPVISGTILDQGSARLLSRARRILCRSATGRASVDGRACPTCPHEAVCDHRMRVTLLVAHSPYHLILNRPSRRNFLRYIAGLIPQKLDARAVITRLIAVDRGSWTEIRFALC